MFGRSIPFVRILGIQVAVHPSWFFVFLLVTWSLAAGFLPAALPGLPALEAWLLGAIAAVLLFVSVLIHEFAHSLVSRARGIPVHSITLFLFGGVSALTGEAKQPGTEFAIAIVGPVTSFVLAAIAFVLANLPFDPRVVTVLAYLAIVNGMLGVFNLIPGYPLDGGRVLRSIVWRATGNVRRATEVAGNVGRVVGYAFILFGLFQLFAGSLLDGIWIAAIGWFLENAAGSSVRQLAFDQRLANVRVGDVIKGEDPQLPPDLSIANVIAEFVLQGHRRALLVADGTAFAGIVTLSDIANVPTDRRSSTSVRELMTPADRCVVIAPSASLRDAAELLAEHDVDQLPVVEDRRAVGMITRADVMRELQIREALDIPPAAEGPDRGRRSPDAAAPTSG